MVVNKVYETRTQYIPNSIIQAHFVSNKPSGNFLLSYRGSVNRGVV